MNVMATSNDISIRFVALILICHLYHSEALNSALYRFHNVSDSKDLTGDTDMSEISAVSGCALRCLAKNCKGFAFHKQHGTCAFVQPATYSFNHFRKLNTCSSCHELDLTSPSGVYSIPSPDQAKRLEVFCYVDDAGQGWTVIQNRFDGSQDFDNTWEEYKQGFGNLFAEFWIGNEKIFQMTSRRHHELRIELSDIHGTSKYILYQNFSFTSESDGYRLFLSGISGSLLNKLSNGAKFSAKDQDNDEHSDNCAERFHAGGWFTKCHSANLNGLYSPNSTNDPDTMCWLRFNPDQNEFVPLASSRMMICPV